MNRTALSTSSDIYSYSVARANLLSFGIMAFAFLGTRAAFEQLWGAPFRMADFPGGVPAFAAAALAGLVLHELIHYGVARLLAANEPVDVSIGFRWRQMLPYVRLSGAVPVRTYRLIGAAPLIVLGLLPAAAGLASAQSAIALYGAAMMAFSAGDLLVLLAIRSLASHQRVEDHPTRVGCRVL